MKKITYTGFAINLLILVIALLVTPTLVYSADPAQCSCTSSIGNVGPGCVLGNYTYENPCGGCNPAKYKKCEKGASGSQSTCFCTDQCDDCDGKAGNDCIQAPVPN